MVASLRETPTRKRKDAFTHYRTGILPGRGGTCAHGRLRPADRPSVVATPSCRQAQFAGEPWWSNPATATSPASRPKYRAARAAATGAAPEVAEAAPPAAGPAPDPPLCSGWSRRAIGRTCSDPPARGNEICAAAERTKADGPAQPACSQRAAAATSGDRRPPRAPHAAARGGHAPAAAPSPPAARTTGIGNSARPGQSQTSARMSWARVRR